MDEFLDPFVLTDDDADWLMDSLPTGQDLQVTKKERVPRVSLPIKTPKKRGRTRASNKRDHPTAKMFGHGFDFMRNSIGVMSSRQIDIPLLASELTGGVEHRNHQTKFARKLTQFGKRPSQIQWMVELFVRWIVNGFQLISTGETLGCPGLWLLFTALSDPNTFVECVSPNGRPKKGDRCTLDSSLGVLYRLHYHKGKFKLGQTGSEAPITFTIAKNTHRVTCDNWEAFHIVHLCGDSRCDWTVSFADMRLYLESFIENGPRLQEGCVYMPQYPIQSVPS